MYKNGSNPLYSLTKKADYIKDMQKGISLIVVNYRIIYFEKIEEYFEKNSIYLAQNNEDLKQGERIKP